MALVTCSDCGGEVSTEAAACPHCGRPMAEMPVVEPIRIQTQRTVRRRPSDSGARVCKAVGLLLLLGSLAMLILMIYAAAGPPGKNELVARFEAPLPVALGLFAVGFLLCRIGGSLSDWVSCPKCQGKAVGGRGCAMVLLIICTFPLGLLLLLIRPDYRCRSCGYKFKG